MKTSTVPLICGVALAAMSTAGVSHWWSVRQFIGVVNAASPVTTPPRPLQVPAPLRDLPRKPPAALAAAAQSPLPSSAPPAAAQAQEKFYDALIAKIENLQNQNRDLLDQVAETNRDLMKLEFRVDTHSEQFRPLPVSDDRIDTSFEDDVGVLPPRAEPAFLPTHE